MFASPFQYESHNLHCHQAIVFSSLLFLFIQNVTNAQRPPIVYCSPSASFFYRLVSESLFSSWPGARASSFNKHFCRLINRISENSRVGRFSICFSRSMRFVFVDRSSFGVAFALMDAVQRPAVIFADIRLDSPYVRAAASFSIRLPMPSDRLCRRIVVCVIVVVIVVVVVWLWL